MIVITEDIRDNIKKYGTTIFQFLKQNIRIVFGSRFLYFLLFAVLLFLIIMMIMIIDSNTPSEADFYYILIIPAVSIILYPSAFGVQSDRDIRMLEVIFGVPDYRYKTWLVRLVLVMFIAYLIVLFLSFMTHLLVIDIRIFEMAKQLMFPTFFCATLAFMFSTVFKNGTAAAVTLIIIILLFFVGIDMLEEKSWYLYFNPFNTSGGMSEIIWQRLILRNRIYLSALSILFLIFGLFNLQKREAFLS